jgi:hypothetical protein
MSLHWKKPAFGFALREAQQFSSWIERHYTTRGPHYSHQTLSTVISAGKLVKVKPKRKKILLIVIVTVVLLIAGLVTGVLPFALNTISCGKLPVVGSTFAASYTYKVPGDPGVWPRAI